MNRVLLTPTFERRFAHKRRKDPQNLVSLIDTKVLELRHADRPDLVGERKSSPLQGTLGIPLIRGTRLLYAVRSSGEGRLVILLRVCSHKETYSSLRAIEQFYLRGDVTQVEQRLTARR